MSDYWEVGFGIKHKGEWRYLTIEKDGTAKASSKYMNPSRDRWSISRIHADDAVYISGVGERCISVYTLSKKPCPESISFDAKFYLLYDTEGRVALKSQPFYRFLGVDLDAFPNGELQCKAEEPGDAEWWTIRLLHHPQMHLSTAIGNQVYAYYNQEANQIHCNQIVPLGRKCQLTLEFLDGKYGVKTMDNKYLHRNGDLVKEASPDTLFALHVNLRSSPDLGISLMDCQGNFLSIVGDNGVLQTGNTKIQKNERFRVDASRPQVSLKSSVNGKYLSIKPGIPLHILFIRLFYYYKRSLFFPMNKIF